MARQTTTGPGSKAPFPTTAWTVLRASPDPASPGYRQALEHLASRYWWPISCYFQRRWKKTREDAADLAQDFFVALCERDFLRHVAPEHGRFRTYVMAALDNFVRMDYRARAAQKRGGKRIQLSTAPEVEGASAPEGSPEEVFDREWARSILARAIAELEEEYRREGREKAFQAFAGRHLTGAPTSSAGYEDLAKSLGLSVSDVANSLYRARQRLRELVLAKIMETVSSPQEAQAELRDLFEKLSTP